MFLEQRLLFIKEQATLIVAVYTILRGLMIDLYAPTHAMLSKECVGYTPTHNKVFLFLFVQYAGEL